MATNRPKLKFLRGSTYTFDVSNADLATHPFKFTADSGSTEYTTGVTLTGTQGQSGAEITFVVPNDAPTNLNYYCGTHGMGMGNHIFIPPLPVIPESDGSFLSSAYRSHYNVTAASGTLYTGTSGTVYFMAVDEGVPPTNESDGSFFTDSDITVTTDSDIQYGGGYGIVFELTATGISYGGARAIRAGGYDAAQRNTIDYYSIPVTGNAQDFGDLTRDIRSAGAGASNGSRVIITGGISSATATGISDTVDYITTSTLGNAQDLSDLNTDRYRHDTVSDGTLAITAGGRTNNSGTITTIDEIEKMTITSSANGTDFGNLTGNVYFLAGWSSSTRAVFMGGYTDQYVNNSYITDRIDYVTTASPGNATDFGNCTNRIHEGSGAGDDTRAIMMGGRFDGSPNAYQVEEGIEYITINTPGNATDFGDLTNNYSGMGSASDGTYACCHGAYDGTAGTNIIERITIQTPGNSTDHGDLTAAVSYTIGSSGAAA